MNVDIDHSMQEGLISESVVSALLSFSKEQLLHKIGLQHISIKKDTKPLSLTFSNR